MPNINFILNIKHEFYILQGWQSNLQCEEALYRNSIPEWWQQQHLMTKLRESDWRSDTRLPNYTMFYSYVLNILIFQVRSDTFHDFSIPPWLSRLFQHLYEPCLNNFWRLLVWNLLQPSCHPTGASEHHHKHTHTYKHSFKPVSWLPPLWNVFFRFDILRAECPS